MMVRVLLSLIALLGAAAGNASSGRVIVASKGWAAIDRGGQCEANVRAMRIAPKGKVQAIAGFAFRPDRSRWGRFHARLSSTPRPGSAVLATLGGRQFLLTVNGNWAWSRGGAQDAAMIEAARSGGSLRIEGRAVSGMRFVDRYWLDGAPTAIDAAAARCAQ